MKEILAELSKFVRGRRYEFPVWGPRIRRMRFPMRAGRCACPVWAPFGIYISPCARRAMRISSMGAHSTYANPNGRYPIRTRLSLTGSLIVARDIAHAKLLVGGRVDLI